MHDFIAGVGMAHGERDSGREAGAGEGLGGCRECKDECVSESYSTSVLLSYEIFSFIKNTQKWARVIAALVIAWSPDH